MRTSCADQIYDLANAFLLRQINVSIIIPNDKQLPLVEIFENNGLTIYSVSCFKSKGVNYLYRTFSEFINPLLIRYRLMRNNFFKEQKISGIIWYSPSIFWGPLVKACKSKFKCKSYLILRDIFPDWALDLGILKKNLIYFFFKRVEQYQYAQADYIGVQSPNNVEYFNNHNPTLRSKIEVLWNWMGERAQYPPPFSLSDTPLAGRFLFVYAGNMGVAQNMDVLLHLADLLREDVGIGFVFIGSGSEKARLEKLSESLSLKNTLFLSEIDNIELKYLLAQCNAGLIALSPKHKAHNIPGKFLSYLDAGLPVLALLNQGNDLINLISQHGIGVAMVNPNASEFKAGVRQLINLSARGETKEKCRHLLNLHFSASSISKRIEERLS
jgi:glycosyltransferase involved in cell wall biosynthesis